MKPSFKHYRFVTHLAACAACVILAYGTQRAMAYERYSSCSSCHGSFTDGTSKKNPPTVFPGNNKHTMHRSSSYMNTECELCHRADDNDNPYIGSSDGIGVVPGLGCTGCHVASGLRAHHVINGVSCTTGCHSPETPPAESVNPPYYGTAYTMANNPCNDVAATNINENWSVGDFVGVDNDGDNLFDQADFDCGPPYRLLSAVREGDNLRVSWETMGGRVDAIQAATNVNGTYADVSAFITNPGVGPVTTNYVEIGGALSAARFYRVINRN